MKQTTKILNVIYCLTVLLFLLDGLTNFDIKSQPVKSLVYFGFLIGTPTLLLWNLFATKSKVRRIIGIGYPTLFLILIIVMNPMKILFSSSAWQTQTILYQNGHLTFKKIEFQMQDIGALGYNKRTVQVIYLTPLFMITSEVPADIDKRIEWIKINKEINELRLKEP